MGSSQLIKMKISTVFKKLGIEAKVDHMSIGEAKSAAKRYDMVFCSIAMARNFQNLEGSQTKLITLKNLLDEVEITTKIQASMNEPK